MNKILTIVIPAFNMEWCIEKNLQTYVHEKLADTLSVLVLDNSSADNTFFCAKKFEDQYPDIFTVIQKQNNGYGSSVNYGIELAKSKYVRIVDADDWVDTEQLINYVENLKQCVADIVQTPFRKVSMKDGHSTDVEICKVEFDCMYPVSQSLLQEPLPSIHSTTYKTEFIKSTKIRLQENMYFVDEEFVILPFLHANTICYYNDFVYNYLIDNETQSTSEKNMVKYYLDRENVVKKLLCEYTNGVFKENNMTYVEHRITKAVGSHFTTLYILFEDKKNGRELAKKFGGYVKERYPIFYKRVQCRMKILCLLNLMNIGYEQFNRIKKRFIRR